VKAVLYAESQVAEYWVVNLLDRLIEVYDTPEQGEYRSRRSFQNGESIRLGRFPDIVVNVDDVLLPVADVPTR